MIRRSLLALLFLLMIAGVGLSQTDNQTAKPDTKPAKAPPAPLDPALVNGAWTGTWTIYKPGDEDKARTSKTPALQLDCKVELIDGKYQATFEGECGRPYKYTIKMEGRPIGGSVMFKGTADLGPQDGGIFDWIGKADAKEFVGFYTSAGYTGTFKLARAKQPQGFF